MKASHDCQPERKDLPESYGEVPHVQDGAMLSHDGWPVDPEVGWSQSEEVVMRPSLGGKLGGPFPFLLT